MMDNDNSVNSAVLANEVKNLALQVGELKLIINSNSTNFITHDVFELRIREIDLRIKELDTNIQRISSSRWVQNTLSAILGAVISILIAYFIGHINK